MDIQPIYRPDDNYHHMLDRLEHIARNFEPAAPDDLRTRFIIALGEIGNVWPASCYTGDDFRS